ncbi:unnamed protein product [Rotaria magnacalcarata]|uniref:Integrase catalytic domain-containing protein n=1 Tax=Rotaria magnacalcarata TaxID=392030 RepID=A0A816VI39_9BILA|nr:unnamed protein product [Rotaria magnacalcarata]CAF2113790.1 unnamed protein product [Rotaria magnacalcarata]
MGARQLQDRVINMLHCGHIVVDMKNNTSAKYVCDALEQIIDWFGSPQTLASDNGPPFNSYEMKKFYGKYAIKHITAPPCHPASNGLVE